MTPLRTGIEIFSYFLTTYKLYFSNFKFSESGGGDPIWEKATPGDDSQKSA